MPFGNYKTKPLYILKLSMNAISGWKSKRAQHLPVAHLVTRPQPHQQPHVRKLFFQRLKRHFMIKEFYFQAWTFLNTYCCSRFRFSIISMALAMFLFWISITSFWCCKVESMSVSTSLIWRRTLILASLFGVRDNSSLKNL